MAALPARAVTLQEKKQRLGGHRAAVMSPPPPPPSAVRQAACLGTVQPTVTAAEAAACPAVTETKQQPLGCRDPSCTLRVCADPPRTPNLLCRGPARPSLTPRTQHDQDV